MKTIKTMFVSLAILFTAMAPTMAMAGGNSDLELSPYHMVKLIAIHQSAMEYVVLDNRGHVIQVNCHDNVVTGPGLTIDESKTAIQEVCILNPLNLNSDNIPVN